MKSVILFGAGTQGRTAAALYKDKKINVSYFADNNASLQGTKVLGIPVISPDKIKECRGDETVIICASPTFQEEMWAQLHDLGIDDVVIFNKEILLEKERFLSYSYPTENEDLILYHVLKNEDDIFWIDVGCNDPDIGSVTKCFYECGHHGINIDMEPKMMEITEKVRPDDINLCTGVGEENGEAVFYSQGDWGGLSTMVEENRISEKAEEKRIPVTTLREICMEHARDKEISFLKIDVEGMEKEVLLGMDFDRFRPKILVIESTFPCTDVPNFEEWEDIVLGSRYHFAYMHGVNRYYVADEHSELDERFVPWDEMAAGYCVLHVDLIYAV